MNRRGSIDKTRHLLRYARDKGFALRTTVIVGFPGETQEDFDLLTDFIRDIRFDRLGAFAFSPEENTPAEKMPDQVPEEVKKARLEAVMQLQAGISLERNRGRIGREELVLVTGEDKGRFTARSQWEAPDSDGIIRLDACRPLAPGDMVPARITGAGTYDLEAREIEDRGDAHESAQ